MTEEESSCFKLVCEQFPLVSSLKWMDVKGKRTLFGWVGCDVYVFDLTEEVCENIRSPLVEPCAYEKITLLHDVVDVVQCNGSIFVVGTSGSLHSLTNDSDSDAEDLFDDVTLVIERWKTDQVMSLSANSITLACASTPAILAILHLTDGFIRVSTVSFDPLRIALDASVLNYPQKALSGNLFSKSIMMYIGESQVDHGLLSCLIPSYAQPFSDEGLLVAGLPNGTICCLVVGKTELTPHFVLKLPFHPVTGGLLSSSVSCKKSWNILFDGGILTEFSNFSQEDFYVPLGRVKTGCLIGQSVVASDFFDTYVCRKTDNGLTSYCCPIKGAVCFGCFSSIESAVLTVTKHGALYLMSLGQDAYTNALNFTRALPDEHLFDAYLDNLQHLERVNQTISAHDRQLAAMSLAMSSDHLDFDFDVQIISVLGNTHLLRVLLQNRMPELILSSKIWRLMISLVSTAKCLTLTRALERDLTSERGLEDVFQFDLTGDVSDFTVSGRLIAFTGLNDKCWPSLKVGEVALGIDSCVQPISCLRIQETVAIQDARVIESLKSNDRAENDPRPPEAPKETHSFKLFKIPSADASLQDFLKKSSALWRHSEWKRIRESESEKLEVIAGRDKFSFQKSGDELLVSGSNVVKCYQMKLALLRVLNRTKLMMPAGEAFIMEIHNILTELEIHEFTSSNPSVDVLKTSFDRKEEFIMKPLIGSQSFQ